MQDSLTLVLVFDEHFKGVSHLVDLVEPVDNGLLEFGVTRPNELKGGS